MKPNDFFIFHGENKPEVVSQCAILIHKTKGIGGDNYRHGDFIASLHDFFMNDNNDSVIGAGRLIGKEDIEKILKSMLNLKSSDKAQLLPSNVISLSETHVAWFIPEKVGFMHFNINGMPNKKLIVPWPKLLMVANNRGRMAVAALKTKRRPNGKTRLYQAPIMNVSRNGAVCTGTATLPNNCGIESLKEWESVIYDTAFSHVNSDSSIKLDNKERVDTRDNLKFFQLLAKNKADKFPVDKLNPIGISIEEFIRNHA